ncbi:MAG: Asp-tRNA(Asn)/Glu-tRNA(Gln) amidotransferase subunit GatB [Acidimicrobiales bacterium]
MSGIEGWETVVGLEVHVELATETKLFCGCRNAFGSEPNTNVCPVCLGLPGSLPVLNRAAVEYAMCLGRALGCRVDASTFSRKNYFYPDMPKDYQVSQYDLPINIDGVLELPDGFRVGIERAHIEEDTGKSTHIGGGGRIHDAAYSLVDYNRAGVPLVEIVSRPDVRTADQARAYANELRGILLATGVSDARMEEGSMRVDANVSVRREGDHALGTRAEVKNLNSIRSLGRAIDYEARRQVDRLEAGERIIQETRHWNEEDGRTDTLRSKEEAYDYRYFPEPDLVPLAPDADWVNRVDAALPLLPAARRAALAAAAGVATADVATIVDRGHDELAGAAIASGADARTVLNRVGNDLAGDLGALDAAGLAALVALETGGDLTATQAKAVLAEMVTSGRAPADIAADFGFEAMDAAALESVVDRIITDHPDDWTQFVEGDEKARGKLTGFFVGLVMKATKGQADGKAVTALLRQKAG